MEFLIKFINEYGTTILYALLTAFAGYLGIVVKNLYAEWVNTKTKEAVARSVVKFVEQVYKDIHGEDKLNEAMKAFSEMLAKKGIAITELEMRVLLEAALAEFNKAFEKTDEPVEPEISE